MATTITESEVQKTQPPFAEKPQKPPGVEGEMRTKPDHGEESYRGHNRLQGKAALITGADSGIGRAVALAFAREGADVLISYLSEHADAHETEHWVVEAGKRAVLMAGDVGQQSHCEQMIQRCYDEFGKLDILVNNAAFQMTHEKIEEFSEDELVHTFRTNVFGMFFLCKAALPRMQHGSTIINTASIEAFQPEPELLAYASTKGAIVTFTKALAKKAMKQGVRVNAVAPGPVWTPLIPSTMPQEHVKQFGGDTPAGRPAQPAELAPLYVFLACDESSYVAGQTIGVTGGEVLY